MHIGKDGKMVHFLCIDPSTKRLAPVKHWAQSIGQDRYVVRTQPAHEGVEVSMMPTATGMMIDGPVARFDLVSVPETEIPEWYFPKLEKALTEMSLREMGINGLG